MKVNRQGQKQQGPSTGLATNTRRTFLTRLWSVLGGLALVELMVVGAAFIRRGDPGPERQDSDATVTCGHVDQYAPGTITAFVRGRFYLARLEDGGFLALSRRCTHLGCTIPWVEAEKRFVCPCHASIFDITGAVVNTPAPRALDIYSLTIENNIIAVDTRQPLKRTGFKKDQLIYVKPS